MPSPLLQLHPHVDVRDGLRRWNELPMYWEPEVARSAYTHREWAMATYDDHWATLGYPTWQFMGPSPPFELLALTVCRRAQDWVRSSCRGPIPWQLSAELRAWWATPHPQLGRRRPQKAPLEIAQTDGEHVLHLLLRGEWR